MLKGDIAPRPGGYFQFAFDNADVNIRTLTGHGTFHSLGGIRFTTPAPTQNEQLIKREIEPPKSALTAERGSMPISWYQKSSSPGLRTIEVRRLRSTSIEAILIAKEAVALDSLCCAAMWAGMSSPPSWNGFMRKIYNAREGNFLRTQIDALPFVNLNPGDPSSIYTALLYAETQCRLNNQKSCLVTFDQPLYAKASEIVASATGTELETVTVRLGGFHLLMSFLGCIGFFMAGSGIGELWQEVYAKVSVSHMLTGHAYSRAIRAHLLTERALVTTILDYHTNDANEQVFENLKSKIKTLLEDAFEGRLPPDTVSSDEVTKEFTKALERKMHSDLKVNGPTAELWLQYVSLVEIIRLFLRAERTSNWELHLYTVERMLPYLHAAGHFNYAKSAHFYLQPMRESDSRMLHEEFVKFMSDGFYSIRQNSNFWSCTS